MPKNDIFARSLAAHRKYRGKLEVRSKVPLATRKDIALAYTPGVAEACRVIAKNAGEARELTLKHDTVAIVSDGSAILGLGNLGAAAAIPVMEGKAALLKSLAGVNAFPICLDTQDTEEIIRIVKSIAPVFGGINLEDIAAPRCFTIEERLRKELDIPVFHDDQHGTATVVLAGLINALRVKKLSKSTARIVVNGAGAAGTAVAMLLHASGHRNIVVCDRQGVVYASRPGISPEKRRLAKLLGTTRTAGTTLADALRGADVFIGLSAPGVLTPAMIAAMRPAPVIFALANPVPEIMPDEARRAGAGIVATGRSDYPNQINNFLVFPGIFRGALDHRVRTITDRMLVRAADALARLVAHPHPSRIVPSIFDRRVVRAVAQAIR